MNTIAILTKLFPKSVAAIQQKAIADYHKSNDDPNPYADCEDPWIDEDHDRLAWEEEQHQEYIESLKANADAQLALNSSQEDLSSNSNLIGVTQMPMDCNFIDPSDRIHLYSKRGVYTVVRKRDDYVTLTAGTLQGKMFVVPIADVKCFYDHNKTMVRKLLKP